MATREHVLLTDGEWTKIEIDPNTEGYTVIILDMINKNYSTTYWSPINTITEETASIPHEPVIFDYNVYVKNVNATTQNPIKISVTRI